MPILRASYVYITLYFSKLFPLPYPTATKNILTLSDQKS